MDFPRPDNTDFEIANVLDEVSAVCVKKGMKIKSAHRSSVPCTFFLQSDRSHHDLRVDLERAVSISPERNTSSGRPVQNSHTKCPQTFHAHYVDEIAGPNLMENHNDIRGPKASFSSGSIRSSQTNFDRSTPYVHMQVAEQSGLGPLRLASTSRSQPEFGHPKVNLEYLPEPTNVDVEDVIERAEEQLYETEYRSLERVAKELSTMESNTSIEIYDFERKGSDSSIPDEEIPRCAQGCSPLCPREGSPVHLREDSPVHLREDSPVHSREGSPVHLREDSPVRPREGSPVRPREGSPVHLREDSLMHLREGSPVHLKEGSPLHLRESQLSNPQEGSPTISLRKSSSLSLSTSSLPSLQGGSNTLGFIKGSPSLSLREGRSDSSSMSLESLKTPRSVSDLSNSEKSYSSRPKAGFDHSIPLHFRNPVPNEDEEPLEIYSPEQITPRKDNLEPIEVEKIALPFVEKILRSSSVVCDAWQRGLPTSKWSDRETVECIIPNREFKLNSADLEKKARVNDDIAQFGNSEEKMLFDDNEQQTRMRDNHELRMRMLDDHELRMRMLDDHELRMRMLDDHEQHARMHDDHEQHARMHDDHEQRIRRLEKQVVEIQSEISVIDPSVLSFQDATNQRMRPQHGTSTVKFEETASNVGSSGGHWAREKSFGSMDGPKKKLSFWNMCRCFRN